MHQTPKRTIMKMIHKLTFVIFLIIFTSCNISTKTKRINRNLIDNKNISLLNIDEDNKVLIRKDYYGTYSFTSWNAYNVANTQVHQVENLDYNSSVQRIENLKKRMFESWRPPYSARSTGKSYYLWHKAWPTFSTTLCISKRS